MEIDGSGQGSGVPDHRAHEVQNLLGEIYSACQRSAFDGNETSFEALAMLLADACSDRDEANLERMRTGSQRILGRVRARTPESPAALRVDGRLLSLIDVAHWGAERSLPAEYTTPIDGGSHAFHMLELVATRPGISNQDIAGALKLHETEVSRAGRRLSAAGLAQKRKLGRVNHWEVTPRGTAALNAQPPAPPSAEVFARLFDVFMMRGYVDRKFSIAELSEEAKLDQSVVEYAVRRLIEMGYLEQRRQDTSEPHLRSLSVNHNRGCAVGVSILRHEILAVLTDAHAREIQRKTTPLSPVPAEGHVSEDEVINGIRDMISEWRRQFQILGVGAEIAGHVDSDGVVRLSPPLRWQNVHLRARLTDHLGGLSVLVENDANVLAVHQLRFGEAGGLWNSFAVVMITPRGEGIGSGLILNRELYRGNEGGAGEIGHYTVRPSGGRRCRCGRRGCLEAEVGVEAMLAKIRRARKDRRISLEDLPRLAAERDRATVKAIRYSGTMLGRGISFLMNTVDPDGVVLSGPPQLCDTSEGRPKSAQLFLESVYEEARARLYPTLRGMIDKHSMGKMILTMPFTDIDRACGAASVLLDAFTGRQEGRQEMSKAMLAPFTNISQ
jgi:predicted NBD/HSP70 family sugar kinase/DNA-binding MarR family transcriptional regulator